MGLPLVKGMVELHGGTVESFSEGLGKGSVFTICLPLTDKPHVIKGDDTGAARPQAKLQILMIEDNIDVSEVLRALLREEGHDIRVANDGIQGITMAKECRPDVVLCDIGMPGMDGYEVAGVLRSDEALQDTFLISLTGYARPEDLERSQAAGFHLQLAKPVDLEELRKALEKANSKSYFYLSKGA